MQPSAFRETYITLTLALIFEDLAGRLDESFGVRAEHYRKQYEGTFARMRYDYDTDDTGVRDGSPKRAGRPATIWLSGRW